MVSRLKKIAPPAICVNILLILFTLLAEKAKYLYGKFEFNITAFLTNLAIIFIADVIIGAVLLFGKNTVKKIIALILICLLIAWCFLVTAAFTVIGVFWRSEVLDYESFYAIDEELDYNVRIAGLSLSEIILEGTEQAEDFYYCYKSQLGAEILEVRGKFYFSEQGYNKLKSAFSNANEFSEVIYSEEEQIRFNMTGGYDRKRDIPAYESSTSVDDWKRMIIRFSDSDRAFYFDLSGVCYT